MTRTKASFSIVAGCALFALAGCGPETPSGLGRVSGRVTLDGQPLPAATVNFAPTKPGGSNSLGRTGDNGDYTLYYAQDVQGAEIGQHRVSISTFAAGDPDGDPPTADVPEKVPAKYNHQSELVVEVKQGDNPTNFDLKSDGPIMAAPPEPVDHSSRCE